MANSHGGDFNHQRGCAAARAESDSILIWVDYITPALLPEEVQGHREASPSGAALVLVHFHARCSKVAEGRHVCTVPHDHRARVEFLLLQPIAAREVATALTFCDCEGISGIESNMYRCTAVRNSHDEFE
jgi:hypothetical protein